MDIQFLDGCAHPDAVGPLFQEYTDMLLAEKPAFEKYLQLQNYGQELSHLSDKYGPPGGRLYLLVTETGEAVGTGAIRPLEGGLWELKRLYNDALMFYAEPGTSAPARVKDKEMEMFILVCRTPAEYLKFFDEDFLSKCKVGQKVRVTGGIYEGAEGYIKRIKKDRRLLVRIEGVAVVATGFIPPSLLEPVE